MAWHSNNVGLCSVLSSKPSATFSSTSAIVYIPGRATFTSGSSWYYRNSAIHRRLFETSVYSRPAFIRDPEFIGTRTLEPPAFIRDRRLIETRRLLEDLRYVQDTPICISPKFADDLVGFTSGKDVATVEESLQCILNELSAWSAEWDMQLNITKTKVVLFGTQQGKVNLVLTVIEQVDCIKYLGVWLDSHVSFMQQAEYAASKATKATWKINRLMDGRKGLTPKTGI